ncbi:ATP-binding cassette domain-containing protein [Halomonas sp. EGI 63088]|uniref:ATP-binding cassette domain-containing protein n=1 Tax=Halomonas flagellata TaxID=2920385 RepID=A0ABS9RV76_9GAMM|nr:ATP-binding cassette domain-containing protein [Halomonas flagellata]MCH4563739.1 ATP-binding cassette domain-containing protein [Halomonas flagellata]
MSVNDSSVTGLLRLARLGVGELEGVDLAVEPGEILCLSGASGSGKSRLLRAVADLEPHRGEVWLGELAQSAVPGHRWRRRVMLVPAESHWWADRVGEHLAEPDVRDLEALGFDREVLEWQVSRLSSGEKQRLALLRALCCEPSALLLDEPTANLDDATSRRVETWLVERVHERGWPVIWVAHDRAQIGRVAKRHLRILDGRLVEEEQAAWT